MSGAAPGKKTTDVHGVAALLRALLAEGQDEQAIELVVGLLSQLVEKNTELELRLRKAMRQQFGRTSEKLSAEQLAYRRDRDHVEGEGWSGGVEECRGRGPPEQ